MIFPSPLNVILSTSVKSSFSKSHENIRELMAVWPFQRVYKCNVGNYGLKTYFYREVLLLLENLFPFYLKNPVIHLRWRQWKRGILIKTQRNISWWRIQKNFRVIINEFWTNFKYLRSCFLTLDRIFSRNFAIPYKIINFLVLIAFDTLVTRTNRLRSFFMTIVETRVYKRVVCI